MISIDEFTTKLNTVQGSYYGFVVAVLTYVKNNTSRLETVDRYMNSYPNATTSDILMFISNQDDFYESAAPLQVQVG